MTRASWATVCKNRKRYVSTSTPHTSYLRERPTRTSRNGASISMPPKLQDNALSSTATVFSILPSSYDVGTSLPPTIVDTHAEHTVLSLPLCATVHNFQYHTHSKAVPCQHTGQHTPESGKCTATNGSASMRSPPRAPPEPRPTPSNAAQRSTAALCRRGRAAAARPRRRSAATTTRIALSAR